MKLFTISGPVFISHTAMLGEQPELRHYDGSIESGLSRTLFEAKALFDSKNRRIIRFMDQSRLGFDPHIFFGVLQFQVRVSKPRPVLLFIVPEVLMPVVKLIYGGQ
ncbi:MAG TPA: hypothetical protein VHP99_10145 [Pyrinomonadaceae bacterium]|nr:hypothetical protein [Pyrinomonadaceae bacterium]